MSTDGKETVSIDRDTLILSALAFGFGALFAWAIIDPPLAHKTAIAVAKTQPSEWPAWVQAIGSVAGICAAVWVARWQQIVAYRDKQQRDRHEEISRYVRANRILQRFEEHIMSGISRGRMELQPGQSMSITLEPIPDELWRLESEFHLMPKAGGPCFTAIDFYRQAQKIVESGSLSASDHPRFIRKLSFARTEVARALQVIVGFLDGID